jgi:hypothetical protein
MSCLISAAIGFMRILRLTDDMTCLPGRAMARTGLRMMPTFPSLPLKSRTVSFPQYGFKAGLSDGAFPSTASSSRRAVCLRPSCTSLSSVVSSLWVEERDALAHLRASGLSRSTPGALAPVQVMLSRSIITYSAPCAPLAGTSRFHRHGLYEMPSLCALPPAA